MLTVHNQKLSAEDIFQTLTQRNTTATLFRLACPTDWLYQAILAACRAGVQARHHSFIASPDYKAKLMDIAQWFTSSQDTTFGLFLCGGVGNGKTTIIYALQRLLNLILFDYTASSANPNEGYRIISAKELVMMAKAYNNPSRDNAHLAEDYRKILQVQILGIDDLGSEPNESMHYGEIITAASDILSYRYHQQLCTFVTSNLSPDEIKKVYGTRIADRMREMMHIINFKNAQSYR